LLSHYEATGLKEGKEAQHNHETASRGPPGEGELLEENTGKFAKLIQAAEQRFETKASHSDQNEMTCISIGGRELITK